MFVASVDTRKIMNSTDKRLSDDLKNAVFELRQADVEARKLQVVMEKLRIRIEYINDVLGHQATVTTTVAAPSSQVATVNGEPTGDFSGKAAAQVIEMILREAGKKLELKNIVKSAIAGGYAKDEDFTKVRANFSSLLTRAAAKPDGRFKKESRGVFALADQ
jgi:hypothetical protein